MVVAKEGAIPTPDELRRLLSLPIENTGRFNLTPSVEVAIPKSTTQGNIEGALPTVRMDEDTDEALANQARLAYDDELEKHVKNKGNIELMKKSARLGFIRGSLGYGDHRLARCLGITKEEKDQRGDYRLAQYFGITLNQVQRGDLRGRRKKEVARFKQRFNGLFTLSSILAENIEDVIDRRVALETPNGKLSEVSISDAIKAGYINIAVGIALATVRQNQEVIGYQRGID